MGKLNENTGFTCGHCGAGVLAATDGGYRNHCPFCLFSAHLDVEPGDRASDCKGLMRPSAARNNTQKGWQILHKCMICGFERYNMVCRDGEQPDNFEMILRLI
jgi:hypothetical protein